MKKLKFAIGINGKGVFLDSFPDDEEHQGLLEHLKDIEDNADFKEKPGIYLASFGWESNGNDWTGDYESYLDIRDLDLIQEFEQEPTFAEREEQEMLKASFLEHRKQVAAKDSTITLGDDLDSKDIYLENFIGPGKIRQVVGLHAVGHAQEYSYDEIGLDNSRTSHTTGFHAIETWGNEYDSIGGQMIGRGSFRLHSFDLDRTAKEWESEGWVRCAKPGENNENKEESSQEEKAIEEESGEEKSKEKA